MRVKLLKTIFFFSFFALLLIPSYFAEAEERIRVLIVPGHDDISWGTQYKDMKEADMNLRLATELYDILRTDQRFDVHITRNSWGYTPEFADYFTLHRKEIISFRENAKKSQEESVSDGTFIEMEGVPHNNASEDVSVKLYGINKWANENSMDAVVHVHFNDYPRAESWTEGIYKGFSIYMPESQMVNAGISQSLAGSVFTELKKKYIVSTYEIEKEGMIPDQELIALGTNGTLLPTVRSILIEYGYIYRFYDPIFRHRSYTIMANLTVAGIKKHFSLK